MQYFRIAVAALIFVSIPSAQLAAKTRKAETKKVTAFASYPPLMPGQTEYTIEKGDAKLTIDKLYLPRGLTLKVAADVSAIYWDVKEIVFEEDVTFDLSRSGTPGKAGPGAPPEGQPGYCKNVPIPGATGGQGAPGLSGVLLTLRSIQRIQNKGSLWIKTDGGAGGEGGTGGEGRQGGGPKKSFPKCDGGHGGTGGSGGQGGIGGSTSQITIKASSKPANRLISNCSNTCNPPTSTRPPGASGNTGVIAVYGSPGCGGAGGGGGDGGLHGENPGRSAPGPHGPSGGVGYCTPADLWEWKAFDAK